MKNQFSIFGLIVLATSLEAYSQDKKMGGLVILKPEVEEKLLQAQKIKTIKSVKPNALAIRRINERRKSLGLQEIYGSTSMSTDSSTSSDPAINQMYAVSPTGVDNSLLKAFPPIGNQGSNGSCVGFTGAYAFTHNTGLVRGYDNKASAKYRCSPSYLYDIAKFSDCVVGTAMQTVANVLKSSSGCISEVYYPVSGTKCDGMATNPQGYLDAILNSIDRYEVIRLMDSQVTSLATEAEKLAALKEKLLPLKQLLLNGYVVMGSFLPTNVFMNLRPSTITGSTNAAYIKSVPGAAPSILEGQAAIDYSTADSGMLAHAMAIVGFDDNAWVDSNHNGLVDSGEVGVIKLANSWGTAWGSNGFASITYRYFLYKAAGAGTVYHLVPRSQPYAPKLLAQINLNTVAGQTLNFNLGYGNSNVAAEGWMNLATASLTDSNKPFPIIPFAFSPVDVTSQNAGVVVDVSPYAAMENFFVSIVDVSRDGMASSITGIKLIDPATNKVKKASTVPASADGSTTVAHLDANVAWENDSLSVQNTAPVANAGQDKNLTLPTNSTSLSGSGSDADGSIANYLWSQVSGPSTATLGGQTGPILSISGLVAGTYVFRLTVTDNGGAKASDDVNVNVLAAPVVTNSAPIVNAGADKSITLPTNSIGLSGAASDSDGSVVSVGWTQISGPNIAVLSGQTSLQLSATGLVQGSYVFRLKATDNSGASASDDVVVTVKIARGKKR